jgi:hypothetical protein
MLEIQSNDLTCGAHVPNQIFLICNHMMHFCKYLIFVYTLYLIKAEGVGLEREGGYSVCVLFDLGRHLNFITCHAL